jgi:hypothetical protein
VGALTFPHNSKCSQTGEQEVTNDYLPFRRASTGVKLSSCLS